LPPDFVMALTTPAERAPEPPARPVVLTWISSRYSKTPYFCRPLPVIQAVRNYAVDRERVLPLLGPFTWIRLRYPPVTAARDAIDETCGSFGRALNSSIDVAPSSPTSVDLIQPALTLTNSVTAPGFQLGIDVGSLAQTDEHTSRSAF